MQPQSPTFDGSKLRTMRLAADLSAGQLARAAGLTTTGYTNLERGICAPSWQTVCRIARALDISTEEFRSCP